MRMLDDPKAWMDANAVINAADGDPTQRPLEPRLWEALRIEMQRRLRRATGEPDAIVTFSFGESSREVKP